MKYVKVFKSRLAILLCVIIFTQQTLFANPLLDFANIVKDTFVSVYTPNELPEGIEGNVENATPQKETSFIKQLLLNIIANIEKELLNPNLTNDKRADLIVFKSGFSSMYSVCDRSIIFSDEYTKEQKVEIINLIIEQIRKDTGSSLPTSNPNYYTGRGSTSPVTTAPIIGIGEPMTSDGYYCKITPHSEGEQYGSGIFFDLRFRTGNVGYYGGSLDSAFYLNGKLMKEFHDNGAWNLYINQPYSRIFAISNEDVGLDFDPNVNNLIEVKTNILGDYSFIISGVNSEIYTIEDADTISRIRKTADNYASRWNKLGEEIPPITSGSIYSIITH